MRSHWTLNHLDDEKFFSKIVAFYVFFTRAHRSIVASINFQDDCFGKTSENLENRTQHWNFKCGNESIIFSEFKIIYKTLVKREEKNLFLINYFFLQVCNKDAIFIDTAEFHLQNISFNVISFKSSTLRENRAEQGVDERSRLELSFPTNELLCLCVSLLQSCFTRESSKSLTSPYTIEFVEKKIMHNFTVSFCIWASVAVSHKYFWILVN